MRNSLNDSFIDLVSDSSQDLKDAWVPFINKARFGIPAALEEDLTKEIKQGLAINNARNDMWGDAASP